MVPNGWSEVKLGDVIKHQKGFAFKSSSYKEDGVRIIRISDTTRNSIHDKSPVYLDNEQAIVLSNFELKSEDIVLSTVGSRPHLLDSMVGKAVKIPEKDNGALLNQNLVKITPKDKLITNNYLFSMLTKTSFNYFISTLVRGNANQVSITLAELFCYTFLLPTYEEQRKIASILGTWDKAISTTERLIDNSKQQKKALMQHLLTGKKRLFDDSGRPFEGEWEDVKLGNYVTIKSGVSPSQFNLKSKGEIPYVKVEDMNNCSKYQCNSRSYTDKDRPVIDKNSVIFPKRGAAIMNNKVRIAATSLYLDTNMMALFPNAALNSEFLYYLLIKEELFKIADTSTIPQINNKHITPYKFKLPYLNEQNRISSVLSNADKEIDLLEQKLADLKQEKKALMQQLLTGKRRVIV
jgi:type I restriction enzyme S subunit